ncbi:hypothetical protein ACB098_10G041500 [Castanea mollissima]
MPSRPMRVINALSLTYQPGPRGPNEIIFSIYKVFINTGVAPTPVSTRAAPTLVVATTIFSASLCPSASTETGGKDWVVIASLDCKAKVIASLVQGCSTSGTDWGTKSGSDGKSETGAFPRSA